VLHSNARCEMFSMTTGSRSNVETFALKIEGSEQAQRVSEGWLAMKGEHDEAQQRWRVEWQGINQSSLLLVYIDSALPLGYHGQCAFRHFVWVDEGACLA